MPRPAQTGLPLNHLPRSSLPNGNQTSSPSVSSRHPHFATSFDPRIFDRLGDKIELSKQGEKHFREELQQLKDTVEKALKDILRLEDNSRQRKVYLDEVEALIAEGKASAVIDDGIEFASPLHVVQPADIPVEVAPAVPEYSSDNMQLADELASGTTITQTADLYTSTPEPRPPQTSTSARSQGSNTSSYRPPTVFEAETDSDVESQIPPRDPKSLPRGRLARRSNKRVQNPGSMFFSLGRSDKGTGVADKTPASFDFKTPSSFDFPSPSQLSPARSSTINPQSSKSPQLAPVPADGDMAGSGNSDRVIEIATASDDSTSSFKPIRKSVAQRGKRKRTSDGPADGTSKQKAPPVTPPRNDRSESEAPRSAHGRKLKKGIDYRDIQPELDDLIFGSQRRDVIYKK